MLRAGGHGAGGGRVSGVREDLVVMKFGGTSVEDARAMERTAAIVAGRRGRGLRAVVVVSAMAKVTDQLLAAAAAAGRGDKLSAVAISQRLRTRHVDTAAQLVRGDRFAALHGVLGTEFDALDDLLRGIAAVGELTPRTNDLVVSFGERMSSRMVAEAFAERGLDGVHVDARTCIVTDATYGKAMPQEAAIEGKLTELVLPLIEAGKTPVMGGFIGSNAQGITTTLGRGGSDYTAALVGGGLHAGAIEIWTDVNGIMTTDPRICPDALRVKTISFEEAAELAYFRRESAAPGDDSAGGAEEHTGVGAEQPRCGERGDEDHGDGAALPEPVQEHRGEEAADNY